MKLQLRGHRILIGWKGIVLDQDFVPLRGRAVKTDHHEVQIDRQRIHHHRFDGFGSYHPRHLLGEQFVVGHPGILCVKMSLHPVVSPVGQFLIEGVSGAFGLQPERIAAQIEVWSTIGLDGQVEAVAVAGEVVGGSGHGSGRFAPVKVGVSERGTKPRPNFCSIKKRRPLAERRRTPTEVPRKHRPVNGVNIGYSF